MSAALVFAAGVAGSPPCASSHLHAAIDPVALHEHLDRAVPAALAASGAPGAIVAVVQGDRVLVADGWGLADIERGRAMDGRSVVRVASLSKTFTATAIAKLEAEGRLDVDTPIDALLSSARVPERFPEPVTLRHLLSHTAGFINANAGRVSEDVPAIDLAAYMRASMPPQLYPPGVGVLYANHGNALAGLVVQDVTGMRLQDYVRAEILDPLGMQHSGYELDTRTEGALATSYVVQDGIATPHPYWHFRTVPASSLMTNADDMARYMIMHLSHGRFEGREILPPAAAARMREPVAAIHPALPTWHYAFAFGSTAGHATRSHGGSVPAFLSRMVLFDELGVGVFVAQNAFGDAIAEPIVQGIARAFLPPPPSVASEREGDGTAPPQVADFLGAHAPLTGRETPAFTRPLVQLSAPPVTLSLDADGHLVVDGDRFEHAGGLVFRRARDGDAPEVVVLRRDAAGTAWVHRGLQSAVARPWHASPWLHAPLWVAGLVVLVAAALAPLAWSRVSPRQRWRLIPTAWAARLVLAGVVVPPAFAAWHDRGQPDYLRPLRFGIPRWLALVDALPWAGAALLVALSASLVLATSSREDARRLRGATLAFTCAALVLLGLRLYWRVPGPGLDVP